MRGMIAGTLLGAAAGMMLIPQMDKRTRKRFERAGRKITSFTNNLWDELSESRR